MHFPTRTKLVTGAAAGIGRSVCQRLAEGAETLLLAVRDSTKLWRKIPRCAWLAEVKTLLFVLGDRGFHVNTLSLAGTLTPECTA